ncbi:uncharacterized protein [Solanum lycopersicum]|uniref:uncharacterized protein n=1 Tax=Solanum lycopersicum TaxID=4081 RepID=UPI003749EB87
MQQKMFFYLTTLSLQRFINENVPVILDDTPPEVVFEKKYKTEDAGMKKFIVTKFLDYKMIDSKTVITQVQELHVIIHDHLAEGLIVNDIFQVTAIIEKLPPMLKNFKNYLKHKRKEMTVEDLIIRLRIVEDNKAAEKRSHDNSVISGVNIVEEDPTKVKKRKKASGPKNNPPKKKFNGNYFNCECNLIGNLREWWIDFGASCHVCANKELFSSYTPAPTDEKLFMANSIFAKVEGTDKVLLKMTSVKMVTLNKVSYVQN